MSRKDIQNKDILSSYFRNSRLSSEVHVLFSKLMSTKVRDLRLKGVFITEVKVARDLRNVTICFSLDDATRVPEVLKAFAAAEGFFKRELDHHIRLRRLPLFFFTYDKNFDELFQEIAAAAPRYNSSSSQPAQDE